MLRCSITKTIAAQWFSAVLVAALLIAACGRSSNAAPTNTPGFSSFFSSPLPSATPALLDNTFSDLPPEGRVAIRQGDPRPAAYWAVWNTCAPDNRADDAAANGGRAAGFFLLDDLITDPGIQLGNYTVMNCEQGLAVLQGHTTSGEDTTDQTYTLAAQLLAAELNLNVGAETCPLAEEAVIGGHLVLARVGFNGIGEYAASASEEITNAIPRLVELLKGYNTGALCK